MSWKLYFFNKKGRSLCIRSTFFFYIAGGFDDSLPLLYFSYHPRDTVFFILYTYAKLNLKATPGAYPRIRQDD